MSQVPGGSAAGAGGRGGDGGETAELGAHAGHAARVPRLPGLRGLRGLRDLRDLPGRPLPLPPVWLAHVRTQLCPGPGPQRQCNVRNISNLVWSLESSLTLKLLDVK